MRRGPKLAWLALLGVLIVPGIASGQYVFYTDTNHPAPMLRRCTPTGTQLATRALPAGTLPEGLAYDEMHLQLYWAEAAWSGARIRRTDAGLGAGTTVISGLGSLRGLVVEPVKGWLFFTSSDQGTARISRARLDGSSVQDLFVLAGFNPRQITVDPVHAKVYWTEFELDAIARCDFDGSAGEFVAFLPAGARPYGIAVDAAANELWWTEYRTGLVQKLALPPEPAAITTGSGPGTLAERSAALVAAAARREVGRAGSVAPGGAPGARAASPLAAQATVISGLPKPTHLALDLSGQRLFVTTAGANPNSVRAANLDGTGLTTLPVPEATYGGIAWYGSSLVGVDGGDPPPARARELTLRAANPAAGTARIEFVLPSESDVHLDVLDTAGRRVALLAEGAHSAGPHAVTWTGLTSAGRAAPGIYLVRLETGGRRLTTRFTLLR